MESKTAPSEATPPERQGPEDLARVAAGRLVGDLPSRRWFGAKARTIAGVTPVDFAKVSESGGVFAIFRVDFTAPPPETYSVPLIALAGPPPAGWTVADAMDDPAFCLALLAHIRTGNGIAGRRGRFCSRATAALPEILPESPHQVNRIQAEQS